MYLLVPAKLLSILNCEKSIRFYIISYVKTPTLLLLKPSQDQQDLHQELQSAFLKGI